MAIGVRGDVNAVQLEVNRAQKSARVTERPDDVLAWSSIGAVTGLVTGAALGAWLFSLRNTGPNVLGVRRLMAQWIQTTLGTAARLDLALQAVRGMNANDVGGAQISASAGKHRTALAAPNMDAKIATTASLTNASAPVPTSEVVGVVGGWIAAVGTQIGPVNLFQHDSGDYPLMLAPNEGIRLALATAQAASAVGVLYVNFEVIEMLAVDWG